MIALVHKSNLYRDPSRRGLGITVMNNVKVLRRNGIDAEYWPCTSVEMIAARLETSQPTHVVISAVWLTDEAVRNLAERYPRTVFTVVSHSNWAFLQADPNAVARFRAYADLQHELPNVRIGGNCSRFTVSATRIFDAEVSLLPNLYDASEPMQPQTPWAHQSPLHLGIFGAGRPLKNGTSAAAAAAYMADWYQVPVTIYLNEPVQAITEICASHPHMRLEAIGWLRWPEFRRKVSTMHLLLQPSFTESFNVVTADGIWGGVPSVVSEAVTWAPDAWKAASDSAEHIATVGMQLLANPRSVEAGRAALATYVRDGVCWWRKYLEEVRA